MAWFLSAAADTASYAPKIVFGAPRGYNTDEPEHQKYYSETEVSSLMAGVRPEFVVNVWGPTDMPGPWRQFKVTVEEVTA